MSGFPNSAGAASGASGLFTVTVIRPGPHRGVVEHIAYDMRSEALEEIGWIAERAPPGAELVLRDPEGADLMRLARLA
jgi:hypothetical protein